MKEPGSVVDSTLDIRFEITLVSDLCVQLFESLLKRLNNNFTTVFKKARSEKAISC